MNHSQTHAHARDFLFDAALDREVVAAQQKITAAAGVAPEVALAAVPRNRRPRARSRRAGQACYLHGCGIVVSMDYDRAVPAAEILRRSTTGVRDGSVILFHEWRTETREQLPAILAELRRRQGFGFVTFSELAARGGEDAIHYERQVLPLSV